MRTWYFSSVHTSLLVNVRLFVFFFVFGVSGFLFRVQGPAEEDIDEVVDDCCLRPLRCEGRCGTYQMRSLVSDSGNPVVTYTPPAHQTHQTHHHLQYIPNHASHPARPDAHWLFLLFSSDYCYCTRTFEAIDYAKAPRLESNANVMYRTTLLQLVTRVTQCPAILLSFAFECAGQDPLHNEPKEV